MTTRALIGTDGTAITEGQGITTTSHVLLPRQNQISDINIYYLKMLMHFNLMPITH